MFVCCNCASVCRCQDASTQFRVHAMFTSKDDKSMENQKYPINSSLQKRFKDLPFGKILMFKSNISCVSGLWSAFDS